MIHYAGARPGGTRAHPSHDKAEPFRGIHFAASIAFLTVTLILSPARGCAVEITRVGQWANQRLGSVYQIALVGNYAYATTDSGLQVFDITSPTNLLPVAGARFVPSQIALSGDYAYLTGRGGFQILSVTNPLAPICIGGTTNLGSSVSSIAVSGNFAYLAESPYSSTPPYAATMHIIDVHDPANPVRVGGTSVAGSVRSISVSGSYACMGVDQNLWIIDIRNSTNPLPTGSFYLTNNVQSLAISGFYAYIALGPGGLQIINFVNPYHPVWTSAVSENSYSGGVTVSGNYAYLAGDRGLQIVDVSNPKTPSVLGRYRGPFPIANSVALSGNYAYLGQYVGIEAIDISNVASPAPVGRTLTTGSSTLAIAFTNNYAYLGDEYAGLQVIDTSHPSNPVLAGSYFTGGHPLDLAAAGNFAYMLDYSNGLQVFSVSNPASPALLAAWTTTNVPRRLAVSGNYAYVAHDKGPNVGISIIDVSNAVSPTNVATYFVNFGNINDPVYLNWAQARSVKLSGSYAYLAYGGEVYHVEFGRKSFGGIDVIDVSNPRNPVSLSPPPWGAEPDILDIALSGEYAYAIYYTEAWRWYHLGGYYDYYPQTGGLRSLNVSNPSVPTSIGAFPTGLVHYQVAISGKYAWLLGGEPGLRVIDISNPTNMVLAATNSYGGITAVSGPYAYMASGVYGLQILCLDCPRLSATLTGGQVLLQWPQSATNFLLETKMGLPEISWRSVPGTPQLTNGVYQLALPPQNPSAFFRLRGP